MGREGSLEGRASVPFAGDSEDIAGLPLDCREEVTTPGSALDERFDGVNRELGKTPKTQT